MSGLLHGAAGQDDVIDCVLTAVDDGTFELQPIILTGFVLEPELYVRAASFWEPVDEGEQGLYLPPSCASSFDTFINAFHEWHWSRFTNCRATALKVEVEGEAVIRIYRIMQSGRRTKIGAPVTFSGPCTINLRTDGTTLGRLAFEIASERGAHLKHACWLGSQAAINTVCLDLVICTFNKPEFVTRTLNRLADYAQKIRGLRSVIVVDQGTHSIAQSDDHPHITEAVRKRKIRFIKQKNLGGSGGFTRGVLASLDDVSPTSISSHVMLMDDDVQFDPRLMVKLIHFLERCPPDVVVGGSMLDMFRPELLFAYSETFDPKTAHVRREHPYDADMRHSDSLGSLEGAGAGNYNGWFICCFPRHAFEHHGLPLPFFIRSDDCEFGTRLTRAGLPIAHMPGLFVWHEPFWNKPRAWIDYYSYRNHLIVAALAAPKKPACLALKQLSEFWYYITTYQYESALAVCIAVEHYCKGPEWVFLHDDARHAAVLREFEATKQAQVTANNIRGECCPKRGGDVRSRLHPAIPIWIAFLLNIYWNLLGSPDDGALHGAATQAVPMNKMWFYPFHEFPVVIQDCPDEDTGFVLRHSSRLARRLTLRMIKATLKFSWRCAILASKYRIAAPRYSSRAAWDELFDSLHEPSRS